MAGLSFTQLPTDVLFRCIKGDDVSFRVDIGMDCTDYSFEAAVTRGGATLFDMTITVSGLTPTGVLYLGMTGEQTTQLTGSERWYFNWTSPQLRKTTVMRGVLLGEDK
jgi:hypothetical protein